ncbi:doublecortin domain-containing protein 2B [Rhinatrema bivittatum]|uniref:doublecortin domain-containing protein 2B n=1 Tax=Rhinatrema bivittatum TaxID=194408 RepID=UPI00112DABCB|nr:doublecortin domain-containing protein 2B [Rhinatrema bivittatum]
MYLQPWKQHHESLRLSTLTTDTKIQPASPVQPYLGWCGRGRMSFSGGDLAPQAKNVLLFRNGDPFHSGRKFVVNLRQFLTFEAFLNEVTSTLQAPRAVRYIYTPQQGHRVTQLDALQNGSCYVAAGFERFKKLNYLNAGMKLSEENRKSDIMQVRLAVNRKLNVSARWRKSIHMPCIIHVFRNGDLLSPPFRLLLSKSMLQQWELILRVLSEKASLQNGAVRKLCTLHGVPVSRGEELASGEYYVAVGTEKYKALPYVELLLSKKPTPSACRSKAQHRHRTHKDGFDKLFNISQDGASASAIGESPLQLENRMVHSTGAQAPPPSMGRQPSREETSLFYAKPVHGHQNRKWTRISQNAGEQEEESVFKVRVSRSEMEGAQEVLEDEETRVELPVDQRAAETVEDEEEAMPWNKQSHKQKKDAACRANHEEQMNKRDGRRSPFTGSEKF